MFKINKDKLTGLSTTEAQFQKNIADKFDDEFASRVGWNPCEIGGNNHTTSKLSQLNSKLLVYKPSFSTLLILLFLAFGAIFSLIGAFTVSKIFWIGLMISSVFIFFLLYYFNSLGKKIYFDKMKNLIYKSSMPNALKRQKTLTNYIKFDEVHAIQLLYENVENRKSHRRTNSGISVTFQLNPYFDSYELNLVLKNSHRINIVDHKNESVIYDDAKTLSKLLNVKIWDATNVDYNEI
jgi:hypothetical protein